MRRGPFRRWRSSAAIAWLLATWSAAGSQAATIRVPDQATKIQTAIDLAQNGDTVLISRGTHAGGLVISGKSVTLASAYVLTGDTNDIALTTINGGSPILKIDASAGTGTTVRGLTFLDGGHQISNNAQWVSILDNHFIGGGDQVSFEGAGGLVRGCRFDDASDDGIDIDNASDPIVENNTIRSAGNDGIEMRLHNYTGPTLQVIIRGNHITGSAEDGIQLIDYPGASNRDLLIEGNVLANNRMVGLGCMEDGNTDENFAGAPLVESVRVIGNTLCGNPIGVTGGDNMLLMNNIIAGSSQLGVKRIAASSFVTHNDFWGNAMDHTTSNVDVTTALQENPRLDGEYRLDTGSPCIDAGALSVMWNGRKVSAPAYLGMAPDLGAHEAPLGATVSVPRRSQRDGLALTRVRPNPTSDSIVISFLLPDSSPARIEIVDLTGRRIVVRELGALAQGSHAVTLREPRALSAGVYQVRLVQKRQSVATPMVVAR